MSDDIVVRAPAHRAPELAWVCEVLLARRLGLRFRIEPHDGPDVSLRAGDGEVCWSDCFLAAADGAWLKPTSLPGGALVRWPVDDAGLRQRAGQPELVSWFGDGRLEAESRRIRLPLDISGSAFFMLSRYEEAVEGAPADRHGRFPGAQACAALAGLQQRALVDEWVEGLWWALQRVAPQLRRRAATARTWVSCDVDAPFSAAAEGSWPALRQAASNLVNRRSPSLALGTLRDAAAARLGRARPDPFDTFDWICDLNERAGHRVTFFFLSRRRPQRIDCRYELTDPRIAALLQRLVQRGHELGLHGSYGSVDEPERLTVELSDLRAAAARASSAQAAFGARQHYLRWRADGTARALQDAGLAYDSTLGFADIAGFRCGTCHAYPLFDLARRKALELLERPLVLMETTVTSPSYLGLGHGERAHALMAGLRDTCRRFGGEFSLLWHNSNFVEPGARELYQALVATP